jgi:hypothetical protein
MWGAGLGVEGEVFEIGQLNCNESVQFDLPKNYLKLSMAGESLIYEAVNS